MTISPVPNGYHVKNGNGHTTGLSEVKSYARIPQVLDVPHLILSQTQSYEWFRGEGLAEVFRKVSPITDYTGKKYELRFLDHYFKEPKHSPLECKEREITYSEPLYVKTLLEKHETEEKLEQEIFMGDIPMMTENGTFIINGAERVVVSQLVRSPGVYFKQERSSTSDRSLCVSQVIPVRGAWLEFETSAKDVLSVKVDRKRKVSVTCFLRALGVATDDDILARFRDVDTDVNHQYIQSTIERDPERDDAAKERDIHYREDDLRAVWEWLRPGEDYSVALARRIVAAQVELYRHLRPGEPPTPENSRNLIWSHFFDPRRYDLGRVGRYKLNRRLDQTERDELRVLDLADIIEVIRTAVRVNRGDDRPDDIDHLGNRRVRAVGELVQNQVRVGLDRMERMVREKMTLVDPETAAPQGLVNIRPVVAAVREFFGGSQLSQFMDQTNPLAELTHKRRLSALGPGGLSRERAGFDVRDVHFSHYGRICPIETPEGPNIGLLSSLSSYARTNPYGFIESPYRKVLKAIASGAPDLEGRVVTEDVVDEDGKVLVPRGRKISRARAKAINDLPAGTILYVRPYVASGPQFVEYMSADREENFHIAQANSELDSLGQFVHDRVEVRIGEDYSQESPDAVDLMDVSPMQIMSISAALIPFLEHDDANRALMGSNMQRQAVPLLRPQVPVVGTGIEERVARDSGQIALSEASGVISLVGGCGLQGVKDLEHNHGEIKADTDGNEHYHCKVHSRCVVVFDSGGNELHYEKERRECKDHRYCTVTVSSSKKEFHHRLHCNEHDFCLVAFDSKTNSRHYCADKDHEHCRDHFHSLTSPNFDGKNHHQCIVVTDSAGMEHPYTMVKFSRTNQGTCFDQRTIVQKGDWVEWGQTLADSSSTDQGKLALGQNVLVAFMSWEGYNYEDAIIISERLVKDDQFTSIHIEKHEMEARETKLGPEEITRDIPNVGEASLRDLDERGIIRVGADVGPGDILVGKVTPKGETELTAEEKLLRAIFGEKSRDVKDTSLRVPHGERGKVI